jgi:hypothetical protein
MEPLIYSRGCPYIHTLVAAFAIVCFFFITLTPNPLLYVAVLPSDCAVLYHMLFAQPFFVLIQYLRVNAGCLDFLNHFFAKDTYFTDNTYIISDKGIMPVRVEI